MFLGAGSTFRKVNVQEGVNVQKGSTFRRVNIQERVNVQEGVNVLEGVNIVEVRIGLTFWGSTFRWGSVQSAFSIVEIFFVT